MGRGCPGAKLGKGGEGLLGLHVGESLTLEMHLPSAHAHRSLSSQPPGMVPILLPFSLPHQS